MRERYNNVFGAKKPFLGLHTGSMESKLLFLGELDICPQNLLSTKHMKPWEKRYFAQRVCWNSHTKAVFRQ